MQSKMRYRQALEFLSELTDYEKALPALTREGNYDLRRMNELMYQLGNPHHGRTTVHIAGTKGKGSTASMVAGVLTAAGFDTGLFTSPHLFSWQERIALNGKKITQKDFSGLVEVLKPYVCDLNRQEHYGELTTFEVLTAMAFAYFNIKNAEFQVLEVGMGGRLDSTNVANGDICIITSISLDHTRILGDTVGKIAVEKAGIIKPGSTVISAPQPSEAAGVIASRCREVKAKLVLTGNDYSWKRTGGDYSGQDISLKTPQRQYKLRLPLLGDYQMENAACAVAAIEALQSAGFKIKYRQVVDGMAGINWPARMQVLGTDPLLVIDGAHNVYSLGTMSKSVKKYFKYRKLIVIFGASSDKDMDGMARVLAGFADQIILTASSHPRAADPGILRQAFMRSGISATTIANSGEALTTALERADKNDLILATGSLFLAAEIKSEYSKLRIFG